MLWDLFYAPTTSHHVPSVGANAFVETDHDGNKNMIDNDAVGDRPWEVQALSSGIHARDHHMCRVPKKAFTSRARLIFL
jgi:hypothetical protein